MTEQQERIAEDVIEVMRNNNGQYNLKAYRLSNPETVSPDNMVLVIKALKELSIIESHGDTSIYRLTETVGYSFPGFAVYRERLKDKSDLERRKLIADVNNAENISKTYRTTRIFAWVGAISGVILLILKGLEALDILHRR